MLKNYLRIVWRNLIRSKTFSFINIMGLALGMTCSLLILLWVMDERSIDNFHADGHRLYVLYERQFRNGKADALHNTPGILAQELKRVIPDIEFAAESTLDVDFTFEAEGKILKEKGGYADADYFSIFSYPILAGDAAKGLASPTGIVISENMAKRFFGSADAALGKLLLVDNKSNYTVMAVFANQPVNSTQKVDYLLNWTTFLRMNEWARDWGNIGPSTFVKLRPEADAAAVDRKIRHLLDKYTAGQASKGLRVELGMQRFGDMYLYGTFTNGYPVTGRIAYVRLFSLIAIFILVIACINFMNLSTARSIKRAKEIGVRKAAGALRFVLATQFICEAIFIAVLSAVVAIALTFLLLPVFNDFTGKQIAFPFYNRLFWIYTLGLVLTAGFISGSYPAFHLSSFKPINVLKGTAKISYGAALFRKSLVVFQFILSMVLIIGTLVIAQQVSFIQKANLGYTRENLAFVPLGNNLGPQYPLFKQQALSTIGVKGISRINAVPTNIDNGTGSVDWDNKEPGSYPQFTHADVGYDFISTMKLQIAMGRDFSKDFPSDSNNYIINEAALKIIRYQEPLGRNLSFWNEKGTIIGVVKDFHFASLHDPIKPLVLRLKERDNNGTALVRIDGGHADQALAGMQRICHDLDPKGSFSYSFSDEEYQKLYKSEQIISRLSKCFAGLAIVISCMGLLGLALFTTQQRMKEIGIRKIIGASIFSVFTLLIREFVILVVIALFIATPLAWWFSDRWLSNYAYRVHLEWWIFVLAGAIGLLIALLTVSYQAIRAARFNPVNVLRRE